MRSKTDRLIPLRRLAEGREQSALQDMSQQQQRLDKACAKLQELRAYLDQYALESTTLAAASVSQISRRYRFVERLREAVRVQESVVSKATAALGASHEFWTRERQERRSLDLLQERLDQTRRAAGLRQEQRELDDVAGRCHQSRAS